MAPPSTWVATTMRLGVAASSRNRLQEGLEDPGEPHQAGQKVMSSFRDTSCLYMMADITHTTARAGPLGEVEGGHPGQRMSGSGLGRAQQAPSSDGMKTRPAQYHHQPTA